MKQITSNSFQNVEKVLPILNNIPVDFREKIYRTPYSEEIINTNSTSDLQMFNSDDIAFVNTAEFSKTAQYFKKYGVYTKASPKFDKAEYDNFWNEEEKRCKEGMVLPGKLHTRKDGKQVIQQVHITGAHYSYLNFGQIKRSKDFKIEKGVLTSSNGEFLTQLENGGHSKSIDFPAFWDGDYYYFKAFELARALGKHLVVGKARRKGYSYKTGMLLAHKANFYRRSTSVVGAYDSGSLFDDGIMNKVLHYLDFYNLHTDWKKRRLHNTLEHIELGFRYKGEEEKRGYLSNIYTAVLKTNSGGMRGKDADILALEEAGKCPNLSEVLDSTLKTLQDGDYTTGTLIVFGTGGGEENYWQGFEDLFYEPYARNFLMFNNVFDDGLKGTGCGFFHPSYMNRPGNIDEFGNSNILGSLNSLNKEKDLLKHSPNKLSAFEMEEPINPSQAFSRASNNLFPVKELDDQLRKLLHDPLYKGIGREGIFDIKDGKVIFYDRVTIGEGNAHLIPPALVNYPLQPEDKDMSGCWILYEQPYRDKNGIIPDDLYNVWHDPFAIEKDKGEFKKTDSLGGTYIHEAPNNFTHTRGDIIVAEYFGRTEETDTYNKQMFLALLYFNGKMLYENDRGDVFNYAKRNNYLELLKDEPEFHYQKSLSKGGMGRKKGISIAANAARKTNGLVYLNNWLSQKRGEGDFGNVLNLHKFYSIRGLRELLKFNGKGNFDAVSTLIVGMFDIKETLHKGIIASTSIDNEEEDTYFLNPFN